MSALIYSPPRDTPPPPIHWRALTLLAFLVLCIVLASAGQRRACTVWTAPGEPAYVTDWQVRHCETLTHRTIPRGEYNP